MRYLSSLKPEDFKNKICLLRLDFNAEDNWRLKASLPTINFLLKNSQAVVILSHRGRPKGFEKALSLRGVSKELSREIGRPVVFIPHFRFKEIKDLISASPKGAVFLLENLRFIEGEAENNPALAEHLASLGDIYVNDAFAVSHRANASVVAVTKYLPSYAGFGMEKEITHLSRVMRKPAKPLMVVLGGLKIEGKLDVYKNLRGKASAFLVGGALTEDLMPKLQLPKILLPIDFKLGPKRSIRDIGPKAIKEFKKEISKAKTIIWNGPVGDVSQKKFSAGTRAIAEAISGNKKAFKVVGGGETVMFLKKLKLDKKIDFVSTGGGAMLEFLAGKKLPGIAALQ